MQLSTIRIGNHDTRTVCDPDSIKAKYEQTDTVLKCEQLNLPRIFGVVIVFLQCLAA